MQPSQLKNNMYNYIKETYGYETLKTVRKLEKVVKKLARFRNHLTFAIKCKTINVQPKGLRLKCGLRTPKTKKIVEQAERKLLHEHTHSVVRTIRNLNNEKRLNEEELSKVLDNDVFEALKGKLSLREETEYSKVKTRQQNKFAKLAGCQQRPRTTLDDRTDATPENTMFEMNDRNTTSDDDQQRPSGPDIRRDAAPGRAVTPERNDHSTTSSDDDLQRPSVAARAAQDDGRDEEPGSSEPGADSVLPSHSGDVGQGTIREHFEGGEQIRDRWVINLSDEILSEAEISVLSKGLNFVPTPKSVNNVDFVTEVEQFISRSNMSEDEVNKVRFEVTKALQSFRPDGDNLTAVERHALHTLRGRKNLMILPSDKGKSVCILTNEQYHTKVNDLVSDTNTYEPLGRDPTSVYARKVRDALKSLEIRSKFSRRQYLQLYPSDPMPPLFYGLPKVHKAEVPLRPIVSTIGSVTYPLAKHLARLLGPLVGKTEHHVKDSKEFVQFVHTLNLAEDEMMVSFDVKSLFTSVPTEMACEVARKRLEVEAEKGDSSVLASTGLDVEDIILLLRLCLDTTYFKVNEKYYKQKQGTAMGSPVSVVVANLFMEEVEQTALQTFTHPVKTWKRYVDDTFVIIGKEHVGALHEHLNNQVSGLVFTVEKESDDKLPFLDVEIRRQQDGSIKTAVYRKATHTDNYLNFQSHHSAQHKESVIRTLVKRGEEFSTDSKDKLAEAKHVDQVLRMNNYPNRFIKATRRKMRARDRDGDARAREQREKKPLVVLPYVKGVTERVTRVLKPHARVATKPAKNLRNILVKAKDKRETVQNTGLVYQYECCQCKKVYIGETCRSIKAREAEHKRAIKNMDVNHSGISQHVIETGHCIAWDEVKILAFETDWRKRKIKEGLFIEKAKRNVLNTKPGVPVANVYRVLN